MLKIHLLDDDDDDERWMILL